MRILSALLITFLIYGNSFAQDGGIAVIEVVEGDTIPSFTLDEIRVFSKHFNSNEERLAFERLKKNTYKVYPYVQTAVQIYYEMENNLSELDKRREQKKYVNQKEEELRDKFEKEIRNLTRSQGDILIKLINRETGNNCYKIVKDMKGPLVAFFWNMAGKMYNHDLKQEYKPEENPDLEFIVQMIKNEQPAGK